MNNHQYKQQRKLSFLTILPVVCFLLFACDNPFNSPNGSGPSTTGTGSVNNGYGKLSISFAGSQARTIFPQKAFDNYVYTFTKADDAPQNLTPTGGIFTLEAGVNWKVDVDAYVGAVASANKAASGTANFTLTANTTANVTVILAASETSGAGTFEYTIQYPAGASVTTLTLQKLPGLTSNENLSPTTAATSVTGTVNVPAGFYLFTVNLSLDSGLKKAGLIEAVHIYDKLTTEKTFNIASTDFFIPTKVNIAAIPGVTPPVTGAAPVSAITETTEYTGSVTWNPAVSGTFAPLTVYTAAITLTAKTGYTLEGIGANYFTVVGATPVSNAASPGVVSAVFPKTKDTPKAADYTITGTGTVVYDGNQKTVTIAPLADKSTGSRTIHYEGTGGTTYTKSTTAPKDVGTYTVTFDVAAAGDWNAASGLAAGTLTINPKVTTTLTVNAITPQTYTGSALTPTVTVSDGAAALALTTDYTVGYTNNTNAGTATVTIAGAGNYAGSSGSSTFTINPKVITFTVDAIPVQTYNGSAHTPAVTVKDGATTLTLSTDYTVAYSNNTNMGTASVTITGAGNYAGSTGSASFTISPQIITFTVDPIPAQTYTGSAHTPTVIVKNGATTLTLTTDYTVAYSNNTDAGTASVTITGAGNYAGSSANAAFTINAKVTTLAIDAITAVIYAGTARTPTVTVRDGLTTLTLTTDYTVTYTNNTNVGTANVSIAGAGNYAGSTGNATFTINPKVITFTIEAIPAQTYNGSAHTPAVTVKDGATTLTPATDYTVTYTNNINVGTAATVSIAGAGNYAGSTGNATFTISPQAITFTVDPIPAQTYTGSALTPTVTVKNGATTLTLTTDYTVSFTNNTNVGTASVAITGAGNYSGSAADATFVINPKVTTALTVDPITAVTYTGSAHTPTVTVKDGATTLITTNYTVSYSNNTNAGTATVTITGAGNYAGSTGSATFTINKAPGAAVGAPTAATISANSITLNAVTAPSNGQTVEYARNNSNTAPTSGWQTSTTFNSLTQTTTYYFFARAVENANYFGTTSTGTAVTTPAIPTGGATIVYYWADEVNGTLNTRVNGGTITNGAYSINNGNSITFTPDGSGYTEQQWTLNGVAAGTGSSYIFSTVGKIGKKYIVGLRVQKGGKYYYTDVTVTIN